MSETFATAAPESTFSLDGMQNAGGILDGISMLKQLLAFVQGMGITGAELTAIIAAARDLFVEFTAEKLFAFIQLLMNSYGEANKLGNVGAGFDLMTVLSVISMLVEFFRKRK